MTEQEVLSLVHHQLSTVFKVERMVLFGSRARGTAHGASDYDILAVVESNIPFVKRQGIARNCLGRRDFPLDLLVYTQEELKHEAAITGSAVYYAELEGKEFDASA